MDSSTAQWVIPAIVSAVVVLIVRFVLPTSRYGYVLESSIKDPDEFLKLIDDYRKQAQQNEADYQKAQTVAAIAERRVGELERLVAEREMQIHNLQQEVKDLKEVADALRWRTAFLERQFSSAQSGETGENLLRVLGIFTNGGHAPLNTEAERKALFNAGIDFVALVGTPTAPVTKIEVLEELSRDYYHGIEIGAHGGPDQASQTDVIYLDDGPAEPGWWSRVVKSHTLKFVVVLACHGLDIADALVNEDIPFVIAVRDTLPDDQVGPFVRMFYTNFKRTQDVEASFDKARLTLSFEVYERVRLFKR